MGESNVSLDIQGGKFAASLDMAVFHCKFTNVSVYSPYRDKRLGKYQCRSDLDSMA